MGMSNVDHFELVVTDVDRAADFYRKLGLEVEDSSSGGQAREGRRRLFLRVGKDEQINLMSPDDVKGLRRTALPGGGHVCLAWDGTMDEYMAQLTKNGLQPTEGRGPSKASAARGDGTHLFILDPDGNSIEVMCYPG